MVSTDVQRKSLAALGAHHIAVIGFRSRRLDDVLTRQGVVQELLKLGCERHGAIF